MPRDMVLSTSAALYSAGSTSIRGGAMGVSVQVFPLCRLYAPFFIEGCGSYVYRAIMRMNIHIGVGSDVVCSTLIGNARASTRGTDDRRFHAFLCPLIQTESSPCMRHCHESTLSFYGQKAKLTVTPPCVQNKFT